MTSKLKAGQRVRIMTMKQLKAFTTNFEQDEPDRTYVDDHLYNYIEEDEYHLLGTSVVIGSILDDYLRPKQNNTLMIPIEIAFPINFKLKSKENNE